VALKQAGIQHGLMTWHVEPMPTAPETESCRPSNLIVFVTRQKEEKMCNVEVIILPELVCAMEAAYSIMMILTK
jgi:hypothetical protein